MNHCDNWKDVPQWLRILWIIAVLNFAAFMVVALINGGDAVNGKEEGGKYFLVNHGNYTEVSKAFFQYSRIHVYSLWITHPAAILGAFWYASRKIKPGRN
jgi:hypothetical protein